MNSRYIIGIDLGTTNSSIAFVDTHAPTAAIHSFRILQLAPNGLLESKPTLPSFCYLCSDEEQHQYRLGLPWAKNRDYIAGLLAQFLGAKTPTRVIQSAKSWLCNAAANRRDKILPFEAADETRKLSPVDASTRYLIHLREAWNHIMGQNNPDNEFEQQEIVLTVPASFDEIARTLTAEAARNAGFVKMTLLEEPQAAFYSWIAQHEHNWQSLLKHNDSILVCDIGGGTTDFSLIQAIETNGKLSFQRMAVGDHLLLGGDNMDVAIAHLIENKLRLQGRPELTTTQWMQLKHQARLAKETLLGEDDAANFKILMQGSGSHVIQGSLSTEISKQEVETMLLEGFFGKPSWQDAQQLRKTAGIKTMGLPYEVEPSIVKHMARFLKQNVSDDIASMPDYVLFNGGAMKPLTFQNAVLNALKGWFPQKTPKILESYDLDLAVSRGAAYFGKVRRGLGVRIGGGTARGYYLKIEVIQNNKADHKALTLLPRHSEEGSSYESPEVFALMPNTPVAFHLYSSHTRLHDKSGDIITIDPQELQLLPPIHTVLRYGKKQGGEIEERKIPVTLGIKLTEIGTLELWLASQKTPHKWSLEFQVRTNSGQEDSLAALEESRKDETFDASYFQAAENIIRETFAQHQIKPSKLMEKLEECLYRPRKEWPPSLLRGLWPYVLQQASNRKASQEHEERWWNLSGFLLRPGCGYPLDDFRIKELWKIILGDINKPLPIECQIQMWICYRRIAAGLNKGQQMQLAQLILPSILNKKNELIEIKNKKDVYAYSEKMRTIASLELMGIPMKIKIGQALIKRIAHNEAIESDYWALARVGARHLLYGSIAHVIPQDTARQWIESLMAMKNPNLKTAGFVLCQLARKTSQRELNMPEELILKIIKYLETHPDLDNIRTLLYQEKTLTMSEQDAIFGEQLPLGLSMVSKL